MYPVHRCHFLNEDLTCFYDNLIRKRDALDIFLHTMPILELISMDTHLLPRLTWSM